MNRRQVLKLAIASALVGLQNFVPRLASAKSSATFRHGVASGDPLHNRVILWTRISGVSRPTRVRWTVARNPDMSGIVRRGRLKARADSDYTVKVDADRLPAGTTLYYQFRVGKERSPIGRTRTTRASGVAPVSLGVVSCSNFAYGYFNVYRELANADSLDAVIHLGDYIYEHGMGEYATEYAERLERVPVPAHEIVTLDDYRQRYAQYRSDEDLQAAHRQHPFIAVWDDHEFTNDSWEDGAENHQDGEGSWQARRDIAIQAYAEWMPVRFTPNGADTRIFRAFRFGDLASLLMLDTRLHGRDEQADANPESSREEIIERLKAPARRMISEEQEDWLASELVRAQESRWQVIGQQVLMMASNAPYLEPLIDRSRPSLVTGEVLEGYVEGSKGNPPLALDTWNGYPAAREKMLGMLARLAPNPVVLSGDLHTPLAGNLTLMGEDTPIGVELLSGSVTSPGFADYLPEAYPGAFRDALIDTNPEIVYAETSRSGWMRVDFTTEACTATWHLVDTVHEQAYSVAIDQRARVFAGEFHKGLEVLGPGSDQTGAKG